MEAFPVRELLRSTLVALDLETTGVDDNVDVVSIAIAWKTADALNSRAFWIDPKDDSQQASRRQVVEILKLTLFSPEFLGTVIFHNLDFDLRFIIRDFWNSGTFAFNKLCPSLADTLTISRVQRNNKFVAHIDPLKRSCHSLKYLAEEYLGKLHSSFEEATDGANIRLADRGKVLKYNMEDAKLTIALYETLMYEVLTNEEREYILRIEMPHLLNLFQMNQFGVLFDKSKAEQILGVALKFLQELEVGIFRGVGRNFNISSQSELAGALFYNNKILLNGKPLAPLFVTQLEQPKVDIDTLLKLSKKIETAEPRSNIIKLLQNITQYLELSKAVTQVENISYYARKFGDNYKIFPRFKADAKSGRVKMSKPNLLGLPKEIFKKSAKDDVPLSLKSFSPRHLLIADGGCKIGSVDVNALDLSVVTHGAKVHNSKFEWLQYFGGDGLGGGLDIHMSVFRRMDPTQFQEVLKPFAHHCGINNFDDYDVKEVSRRYIKLVHQNTSELLTIPASQDVVTNELVSALEKLNKSRKLFKEVNLSTSYLVGDNTLSKNINEKIGLEIGPGEARDLLDRFYRIYPEVRRFQDRVSNAIYDHGFYTSILGRKYYADCFDELNAFYNTFENTVYEFICLIDRRYWYLKAEGWKKEPLPVVENMDVIGGPFSLRFERIVVLEELDRDIFRKRDKKAKSRFRRKSEENQDDVSDYVLNRIQITQAVRSQLSFGFSLSERGQYILDRYMSEGGYFIPEKHIVFFKVDLKTPASRYFRFYVPFKRVIRKFFPLYCQGVANSIATMALTKLRLDLESTQSIEARILLFIHDEIVVQSSRANEEIVASLMMKAICSNKEPFDVSFVQVKSQATKKEYSRYLERFNGMEGYTHFFFVVHTPSSDLVEISKNKSNLYLSSKIASLVIKTGLTDWLLKKVG